MALWLIMMFAGLTALGLVFYKVWTAPPDGIDRRWFIAALAGTLISVAGLVMTLRSMQKEPAEAFLPPQATIEKTAPPVQPVELPASGKTIPPGPGATPGKPTRLGGELPVVISQQYPEDPKSPSFTKAEVGYFINQTNRILVKLEEMATQDQVEAKTESRDQQGNRWIGFAADVEQWMVGMRTRGVEKKGPGSQRVRELINLIGEDLMKLERNYHNHAIFKEEINDGYISEMRSEIERATKELERLGENPGGK